MGKQSTVKSTQVQDIDDNIQDGGSLTSIFRLPKIQNQGKSRHPYLSELRKSCSDYWKYLSKLYSSICLESVDSLLDVHCVIWVGGRDVEIHGTAAERSGQVTFTVLVTDVDEILRRNRSVRRHHDSMIC